jgi:hypothetical protein
VVIIRRGPTLIGGSSALDNLGSYDEFRRWYNDFIDGLFADLNEIDDPVEKLNAFMKAMNVQHYFHLLPDGNGRTYMVALQYFALTNDIPQHTFDDVSPADYVNRIEGLDDLFYSQSMGDLDQFFSDANNHFSGSNNNSPPQVGYVRSK